MAVTCGPEKEDRRMESQRGVIRGQGKGQKHTRIIHSEKRNDRKGVIFRKWKEEMNANQAT